MAAMLLIPAKRLRMIPREVRLAHEFCYFVHDQCVHAKVEYEKNEGHLVRFKFRSQAQLAKFERLSEASDPVTALRAIGREAEARRVVLNSVTMKLASDCLHHIFEALKCLEKRKFVVALNLLRKPMLDSLIFLSWMLGDEDGFYEAFTKHSPQALDAKSVGNQREKIIADALRQTSLSRLTTSAELWGALFDPANKRGLYWLVQRAVHLVTTQRIELATEPENFNFIFKRTSDDDVYHGVYDVLPLALLYLCHVIMLLLDRMTPMDPGALEAFRVRSIAGYRLISGQAQQVTEALSNLSGRFQCIGCETHPRFTPYNAARAVLAESFQCTRCRRLNAFPFALMF